MPVRASVAIVFFGLVLLATFVFHALMRRGKPERSLSTVLMSAALFDGLCHALALTFAARPEDVVQALPISVPLLLMWGVGLVVLMDLGLRVWSKRN